MVILKRTEKAMITAMCRVKLIEKRCCQELKDLLSLEDTLDRLANANKVCWYGHTLRRDNSDVLRKALDFEVVRRRGHG